MKIRPFVTLFTLFLFFSITADAQYRNNYKRHGSKFDIRAGVHAGLVLPKFTGDEFIIAYDANALEVYPEVTYQKLSGFTAGLYADIRFSDGFHLRPELNFTQLGTSMDREADILNEEGGYVVTDTSFVNFSVYTFTIEKRLNYLSLPIILQIPMGQGFNFMVGPQFGFKISESEAYGALVLADSLIADLPFIDPEASSQFKDADFGVVIGLNFQLTNGLNLNARFNKNFKNINKNEGLRLLTREPDNSTQAFIFTLGYTFLYDKRLKEDPSGRM